MEVDPDFPFVHLKAWLAAADADLLTNQLHRREDWVQGSVRLFGRVVPEPRLTLFEGDPGINYTYAHRRLEGRGWSPELRALRDRFRAELGVETNTVLANLYRDGRDSMGWHRDHEPELGPDPWVVSVSLGEARDFDVRRDADGTRHRFTLAHGDLLLMGTQSQTKWTHSVPKRLKIKNFRINLTFRHVFNREIAPFR
ncbi:MAG: alpha-ketoglutarate-dependent dioxygenase AlkB family protein [Schleiferiaceae bacterium]